MTSRILIAVPCLDQVSADFAFSLCALFNRVAYDRKMHKEVELQLAHRKGSLIMVARNELAQTALDRKFTHLLFLDSDMTFPPDTLDRLLFHHVPIVGATYPKRYPPHPLIGTYNMSNGAPVRKGSDPDSLVSMAAMPLGCTLIRTSVFAALPRPYFAYIQADGPEGTQSEDTYFCNSARAAGLNVWMDPALTLNVGHVGMAIHRPGNATQ